MIMRFVLSGCLALSLAGCGEPKVSAPSETPPRPAKLLAVVTNEDGLARQFPAQVEADDKALLSFRVSGVIESMPIKAGMDVAKGQVLAALDSQQYQLQLDKARAQYQLAQVQFNRAERLHNNKVIAEQRFDEARSALSEAAASLEQAQTNLNYTQLKAPYAGTVSLRMKEENEFAQAQAPVLHIQSKDIINVSFQLPERYFHYFAQHADNLVPSVSFDTHPSRQFPAQFKEIDTEADPKTASYHVTVSLNRPDAINVLPGMAAKVHATIPTKSQTQVPQSAVLETNEGTAVWRVGDNGEVKLTPVTLREGKVVSGLENGEVIVATGVSALKEGDRVKAWVKERGL
ncbi:efflux transporter periplasmic adaptor subunit [Salinivibrio kushneri]|uniref:Efflux transporter periplasmic adaptor subunit n=1 Tax=Salinivibrio kushneri TaxID=1908198 RepID=A0AB36K771_9GAMM|nr:efflux RND transporter periplasmic adaptor subunit [Salinivibrio kushneri]OOE44291.1 efflux transporter periplasmic adaptor subunit [Salinivibrio kushneri]OOE47303.1 efflux transporter periplasmic adaptor subunit [Salinivibrio kushneri]